MDLSLNELKLVYISGAALSEEREERGVRERERKGKKEKVKRKKLVGGGVR